MPFVSIVLPVRNEASFIVDCLAGIAAQDYPRDRFELILADGASTDATVRLALDAAAAHGLTLRVIDNPRRSTAAAMNLGIEAAKGDVILKVDGHTEVPSDFVSANVRVLQETGADCVGGPIETVGRGVVGRAIALAMSSPFGIGDTSFRNANAEAQETDSVPFGAYRREVFDRIGPFAEDINRGEDDELNYRLRDAGGRIVLSPAIRSTYYCRDSLDGLTAQYWRYGLAKAAVLQRHPRRLRPRHLVPSALVAVLAKGLLLSLIDRRFAWLTAAAATAYGVANLMASARVAKRAGPGEARYLPAAFACIHLSAGAGFIAGIVRHLVRRC